MTLSETIFQNVSLTQQAVGESKVRIARDRPVQQTDREPGIFVRNGPTGGEQSRAGAEIEIIGLQIRCGLPPDFSFFGGGKTRVKLSCDRLCQFTFDSKDVVHLAIVLLGPNLAVRPGIDQLGVNPNAISRNLNAPLQHGSDAKVAT